MKKLTLPLSLAAAAALSACAGIPETRVVGTADSVYVASRAVPTGVAIRPGLGRVGFPMSSTTPVNGVAQQVVTMTMKDGSKQTLLVQGSQLRMAETVEITSDGRIRRFWLE